MSELPANTYQQIVDGAGDGIIVADSGGVIRVWNESAARIFGFSAEEALGQTLDLIIPEKQRDRHWTGYDKVLETGETKYGHSLLSVPAMRKDGTRMSVDFTIAMIRDDSGKVTALAAVMRDVTAAFEERRSLHARIRELEGKGSAAAG